MERNVKCLVCKKNHIFFFQMSWKDVLSKKSRWNMIFLVLSGKMIFLFLENIILAFRRKMKDYLSQKNTWKYHIFFKKNLSKKIALEHDLSCSIVWKDEIFFLEDMILFFRWKWKMILLKKDTWKYDIFCIYV